jgi:hypothetical protein
MRRVPVAFVAALLLASLAWPVSAAKPAVSGFLPANANAHGYSAVDLATANLWWSASLPFDQSPWVQEQCGPSQMDSKIWFLGGPPAVQPSGPVTCRLPQGTFLVVEAADLIAAQAFDDGDTPGELLTALDTYWPYLLDVEVTLDGRKAVNPTGSVVTSRAVMLPADNMFTGGDPTLARARYYQFVAQPMSRGTHTLRAYYRWAEDWFGEVEVDYTIIVR